MNWLCHTILILFCLAMPAYAHARSNVDLQSLHGKDLMKADFVIRYKFSKLTQVPWEKSTYLQRQRFLEQWHQTQTNDLKLQSQEQKERAQKERQKKLKKIAEKKKMYDKARAEQQRAKKDQAEIANEKKRFENKVKTRINSIEKLRSKDK